MKEPPDQSKIPAPRDDELIENAKRQLEQVQLHADAAGGAALSMSPTVTGTSPADKTARHLPKIEGYQIVGILGQGGMGIVYRAVQTKLNRTVALKVLPAIVGTANPSAVARFRREATAAARLHHTHIVPIYDFGESRDSYYYAMELISGKPLNTLIRRFAEQDVAAASPARLAQLLQNELLGTPLAPTEPDQDKTPAGSSHIGVGSSVSGRGRAYYQQVARWMADAADALHYAHGQEIIHRDVKPGNLILSTDGRIMICDFGLAKTADDQSYTMTGTLVGTLRYLSPEQAMAKRVRVDHRTDIYSLGATMYELLCFQPACPGDDDKEILGAIIARDPKPPRKITSTVPSELETICLKCMEKSPEARYATARALAEDLRRYSHDLPIVAKRPGPIHRLHKFVRRHKAQVIAVTAGVLLTVVGVFSVSETILRRRETVLRQQAEVEALLEEATRYQQTQQWSPAMELFEQVLERDPANSVALGNLAILKKEQFNRQQPNGDPVLLEEAVGFCERGLEVTPPHSPTRSRLLNVKGVSLKILGRYEEAAAAYEQAIAIDPDNSAAWENLGVVNALAHDLSEAEEHLSRAAELCITEEEQCEYPWRNLATLELHLGDAQAAEHIERAIDCNPQDPATLVLRARMYLQLEGHVDIADALRNAEFADLGSNEKDAKIKRILALAHLREGQYEMAVKEAAAAIELNDMKTINYLIMAIADAKLDSLSSARRYHDSAREHWPEELREKGAFVATAPAGILWFESDDQLRSLQREAADLLFKDR